jgi:hypothetical protein
VLRLETELKVQFKVDSMSAHPGVGCGRNHGCTTHTAQVSVACVSNYSCSDKWDVLPIDALKHNFRNFRQTGKKDVN